MKYIFLIFPLLFLTNCTNKTQSETALSKCLQEKIEHFETDCEDATVVAYKFQGDTVYTFNHGSCVADYFTHVYDKECKQLGTLGGFAGNMTINEESFTTAIKIGVVWQKE